MSKSTHQFEIRGVDKSAGAFGSIKNRAAVTSAQIRSMVGGAIGALGAYFTFSSIKGGIDELGHLSDVAQRTSTSVDELTQTAAAMSAIGVNMGVDQLAKAFDYMAKSTGRSGMEGFYQTIDELGKVDDVSKRAQAAMQAFGRSGMEFMPLINAADTSVEALKTVVDAMPKIPQSAADAGDAMSDAMGFAANQAKSIWLQGLGAICGWFDNEYKGGVREASLSAGNYLEYYTKVAVAKCITWYKKLQNGLKVWGDTIGAFVGAAYVKITEGGSWDDVWNLTTQAFSQSLDEYEDESKRLDEIEAERTERFKRNFDERKIAIEKFQGAYNKAAVSIEGRKAMGADAEADIGRQTRISNDLVMAGSNAAMRMQILGPTLQSESKKQTALLERIATNTEKTADNTEESTTSESMGVID
jgi:hypothetical protein